MTDYVQQMGGKGEELKQRRRGHGLQPGRGLPHTWQHPPLEYLIPSLPVLFPGSLKRILIEAWRADSSQKLS